MSKTNKAKRTAAQGISRMPKSVRDEVSRALVDGADWKDIRAICKEHGFPGVRAQNVTNYRKGFHKTTWLPREERLEAIRRDSEATAEIVGHYVQNGGSPAEAGLIAAAEVMSKALTGLGPESLKLLIAEDPKALFGITRELSRVAKLLQVKAMAAEAQPETADSTPDMTEEEQAALVVKLVDQALFSKK